MPKLPFQPNSQVEHPKYGLGSVIAIDDDRISIKFDDHGEKKFVTSIVLPNLKKSDRKPPPDKRSTRRKKAVPIPVEELEEETKPFEEDEDLKPIRGADEDDAGLGDDDIDFGDSESSEDEL
jgi:hypothetical protein